MKNAEIILRKSVELMKDGVISGQHAYFHYTDEHGNCSYIQVPELLYTKAEIEAHGWELKDNVVEDERLKFPIWVKKGKRKFIKVPVQFYKSSDINRKTI